MPSIIEGYNYDIFISYRQKDNKGDMWVSEFIEADLYFVAARRAIVRNI